ncbi:hypothetical protein, partial [Lacticaseibacillus pantheris]|uniref:hypothetical protein n=1 Tax=Lacticaseibacillus pantheris TaxID=171523 RepID=UPI00138F179B
MLGILSHTALMVVSYGLIFWELAVLAGAGAVGYCDFVDRSTVTAVVAGRTGVVAPVERLVPATG